MKINDVVLKEDWDDVRGSIYKYTGLGGGSGNAAATRTKFISDFANQFRMAQKSATKGGVTFSAPEYIQAYLRRYNWFATPAQIAELTQITDPTKLANAVYAVGIQQSRDKHGQVDNRIEPTMGGPAQGNMKKTNTPPEDTTLEPTTQTIIKTLKTIKGSKYEADLREIIKQALWNLYGTDKQDYSEFVKSIMAGKTKQNPAAQQDDNPNLVRGSNE